MRVLHVVPSLYAETGGPARSIPILCRALQAMGVDVTLYTFRRPGAETTISQDTETFPIEWFVPAPGSRQFPTVAFYHRLRQGIRQFDLVHLHSLWNPAISVAALACRQAGVPYLLSPRGMLQDGAFHRKQGLKTLYFWLLERRTLAGTAVLHFFTRAETEDSYRFLSSRTSTLVIPSGIDPSSVDEVQRGRFRQSYPDLEGKRLLLCLGRLHWSKGLALQAQALALLVKDFPDLVWVLVGPDEGE